MRTLLGLILCILSFHAWSAPMDGVKLAPPLPANLWIELSKKIQPGVVGIYIEMDKSSRQKYRDPMLEFIEEFFGKGFQFEAPQEDQDSSPIGTGFIISKDGLIVTNYHVVEPAIEWRQKPTLKVKVSNHDKLIPVEVVGSDPRGDLAVLKLKEKLELSPLEFGDSDQLQVGEYVAAFGNPYGHTNSMTVGIVSAMGRAIKELNRFPFIQTDASINPGNSGGPLLNTQGYVIGVNSAIDARAQGIGFAIPSNFAKKIVSIIEKGGVIKRGFLGIGLGSLSPRTAMSMGLNTTGVVVTEVRPQSPAAQAGIQVYDIVTEFNNKRVHHPEELVTQVQDAEIGKQTNLKVLRRLQNGSYKEIPMTVVIGTFPDKNIKKEPSRQQNYKGQKAPYNLGFAVVDSSSGARLSFDVPVNSPFGPIVSEVDNASPAAQSGLQTGDIILEVNNKEVHKALDVIESLKQGQNELTLLRQQKELKLSLKSE